MVSLGAAPENVEVTIEVDQHTHRVRATAMGASEMRARQRSDEIGEVEAREIAAKAMGVGLERVALAAATPRMRVFQGEVEERGRGGYFTKRRSPVRGGRSRRRHPRAAQPQRGAPGLGAVPRSTACGGCGKIPTIYNGDSAITPDIFVIIGEPD